MNQYSKSLLTISHHPDNGWSWMEIQSISLDLWNALGTFYPDGGYSGQIHDEKCTFLCFIIAMSDQDLFECFGIPLPTSHKKA